MQLRSTEAQDFDAGATQIFQLILERTGKYEDEIVDLLGFNSIDSWAFRKLKRNAIYKFAYVLNLIV